MIVAAEVEMEMVVVEVVEMVWEKVEGTEKVTVEGDWKRRWMCWWWRWQRRKGDSGGLEVVGLVVEALVEMEMVVVSGIGRGGEEVAMVTMVEMVMVVVEMETGVVVVEELLELMMIIEVEVKL